MRLPQVSERVKEAPAQALRGVFAGIGQLLLVTDKLRHKTPAHTDVAQTHAAQPTATPDAAQAAEAPAAVAAEPEAPAEAAPTASAEAARAPEVVRDFDKTGNVRLLTEEVTEPAAEVTVVEVAVAEVAEAEVVEVAVAEVTVAEVTAAEVAEPAAEAPIVGESAAEVAKTVAEVAEPAAEVTEPVAEVADVAEPAAEVAEPLAEVAVTEVVEPAAEAVVAETGGAAPLPNYDELTVASLRARLRNLSVDQVRELAEYERTHAGRPEVISMFERRVAKLEAGA
jgi:hypothetical protein